MGKSTAAGFMADAGVPVVDTDEIARELVKPGSEALGLVRERFGAEVLNAAGSLNRRALAKLVFGDAERRRELEAILHPRIRAEWQRKLAEWQEKGWKRAVVVIPLLFETGAESLVSETICVACTSESQRKRLRVRGWGDEEIEGRVRAQWPIAQKMDRSDHVVWSEGPRELTKLQLEKILR